MKPFCTMVALVAMLLGVEFVWGQDPGQPGKGDPAKKGASKSVSVNDPKAFKGYTLISPMNSKSSHLVDMDGRIVHSWQGGGNPACAAYLQPDGAIFRPATGGGGKGGVAGAGGRLQELAWDGTVIWDYTVPADRIAHHDAIKMPNGNYLAIFTQQKSAADTGAAGRKGGGGMYADGVMEIKPRPKSGGDIVWQWSSWDHKVQDVDPAKPNYGKLADNPGLVDVNYTGNFSFGGGKGGPPKGDPGKGDPGKGDPGKGKGDPGKGKGEAEEETPYQDKGDQGKGKDQGKKDDQGKGGKGAPPAGGGGKTVDWNHFNGLDYNAELDQIIVSVHSFSEFWIIDHSTTKEEAATNKGGKQGKGGDLLYRWGNPRAHGAGTASDQQLFFQHNAQFIRPGLPGAGHVLVFNNGLSRPGGNYSQVDEIVLPVDAKGSYTSQPGKANGPAKAVWSYSSEKKSDFYATNLSGAQRLPNGNTLICMGPQAVVIEVTPTKEVVWKYTPGGGGKGGGGGGMQLFRALRISPDHPALAGKTLTAGSSLDELQQKGGGKGK